MKAIFLALLLFCSNTFAAITDGKFGINQIFDVQYWWNGTTLNASNFIAPYNKNFQTVTVTAGQYFQFFNSTTNPGTYGLKLMNSNGTQHSIVHDTGDITALGSGAIFYIGSGFFGNVITTAQGYNYGASAQFTNMDTDVTSSDLNNYSFASSTPLAAGQTAEPAGGGGSAPVYTSEITTIDQSLLDAARTRRNAIGIGNKIDLNVEGPSAIVTIEQVGNYNRIQGLGGAGTNAHIGGFSNSVNIKQGDILSGRNLVELSVQGNGNNVTLSQARNISTGAVDASESGGHIARVSITGNVGSYVLRQGNDSGTNSGHFLNYTMTGSGGTHSVTQSNNGGKLAFISIAGNYNNESVTQSGAGNHFLDLSLNGNSNSASITQTGSAGHKATVNLTNVGGASALTLLQQGNTAQIYSISQQCANLSGCSISVTQGN
jgi:hypothetical protein